MRSITIPLLLLLPGAWIAFGLPLPNLTWKARVALALALSPLVLPAQLLLLRLLGLGFARASWIALLLNVPAVLLVLRCSTWSQLSHGRRHLLPILLSFAALAIYMAYPWFSSQPFRIFGFHNFMQIDMIYALTRNGPLPEEPQMAGLPLSYPWFSHSYLAAVGWLSDVSPTYLLCVINPVLLLACIVFWYEASNLLGFHNVTTFFVAGLIGLSGNFLGTALGVTTSHIVEWGMRLGDTRTGPFLGKFIQLQAMNFGLTVFSGLVLVCVTACRQKFRFLAELAGLLLVTLGLTYVSIFPAGALLVVCLLLLTIIPVARDMPRYSSFEIMKLAVALLLAGLIVYAYMSWMTRELTNSGVHLITSVGPLFRKAVRAGLSLLIPGALAMYFAVTTLSQRRAPILLLTGGATGAIFLFVFTRVSSSLIEYKFLFCAIIMLSLLAGGALDTALRRRPRMAWVACGSMVALLLGLHIIHSYKMEARYQANLTTGPRIDESSFWLSLDTSEPDAAWTRAIRERTPENTVVVVGQTRHHLGTYLDRSLLIPVDRGNLKSRVGYAETGEYNLVVLRGYPENEFKRRLRLVDSLYTEANPRQLRALMLALGVMNRPIAIHFAHHDTPLLQWLKTGGAGFPLYTDARQEVWFIDRTRTGVDRENASTPF
jgi:hypothetical protein